MLELASVPSAVSSLDVMCTNAGFQVIDTRQRHAKAHMPAEEHYQELHQRLGGQHSSHETDALTEPRSSALTEPRSSAEDDVRMPEPAATPQQPHTRTQHSNASAGFAVDFGDTATSSEGTAS